MREHEIKQILQELDQQPLPSKEKVLAACEESFEKKEQPKAATVISRRIFTKHGMLRVGALAACLCLLVTGIFGGVGLLKNQFGDATAPVTQSAPDLPLDHYPNGEVDYANMSMVEYMELHPDFLSYHCLEWKEGYSFVYLEVLSVERGYRWIAGLNTNGSYDYASDIGSYYGTMRLKCRVIEDAWGILEPGSEINLFVEDPTEQDLLEDLDSFLLKMEVGKFYIYDNVSGEEFYSDGSWGGVEIYNCYPVVDGKIRLEDLKRYLKLQKQNNPSYFKNLDIEADLSKVATIVGEGCDVETSMEKLRIIGEKYQSQEYHRVNLDLVSKMTYGEYCRMMEGTLTKEDFKKLGTMELALAYAALPGLVTREFSLSDGTKFEISTRVEIPDSYLPSMVADFKSIEEKYTDENGVLDSKACVEMIQSKSLSYSFMSIMYTFAEGSFVVS